MLFRNRPRIAFTSAFSVWTWGVAFLPSVTTAVLHDRNLYGGSALAWLASALVGALAAGVILGVAHATMGARRPRAVVLLVFALAGVARGIGVGGAASALGLVADPQWGLRAASGAVLALFWLTIATIIVDGFRTHRHTRAELAAREADVRQELERTTAELTALRARAEQDVTTEVGVVVRGLESLPSDDEAARMTLQAAATRLHDLSSGVVRPLSHETAMLDQGSHESPVDPHQRARTLALRAMVVDAVTVDPFRPGWLVLLLLPSILMTAIRNYGVGLGLLGATWIAAMAAAVLWIARRGITPRLHRWPVVLRAVTVVSIWAMSAIASALPVAWSSAWGLGPERSWAVFGVPLLAYVPITCLGIAIATAISQAWALDEDARAAQIAALDWQQARQSQELWSERKRLGQHLHGTVQSTLTAAALTIDAALRKGTSPQGTRDEAVKRLAPLLAAPAVSTPATEGADVAEVLTSLARVWSRLADVTVSVSDSARTSLTHDVAAATSTVEIVREGLTNAIKHGRSTHITVSIVIDQPQVLTLDIDDDGSPSRDDRRGLGSSALDDLCLSWSRGMSAEGGTRLMCRIPLAPPT